MRRDERFVAYSIMVRLSSGAVANSPPRAFEFRAEVSSAFDLGDLRLRARPAALRRIRGRRAKDRGCGHPCVSVSSFSIPARAWSSHEMLEIETDFLDGLGDLGIGAGIAPRLAGSSSNAGRDRRLRPRRKGVFATRSYVDGKSLCRPKKDRAHPRARARIS